MRRLIRETDFPSQVDSLLKKECFPARAEVNLHSDVGMYFCFINLVLYYQIQFFMPEVDFRFTDGSSEGLLFFPYFLVTLWCGSSFQLLF